MNTLYLLELFQIRTKIKEMSDSGKHDYLSPDAKKRFLNFIYSGEKFHLGVYHRK